MHQRLLLLTRPGPAASRDHMNATGGGMNLILGTVNAIRDRMNAMRRRMNLAWWTVNAMPDSLNLA
jgi:hypothetical protein